MTIKEQLEALAKTRAAKAARIAEIMTKAATENRTTDAAEAEEVDTLTDEVKKIDGDVIRLKNVEALNVQAAVPVAGGNPVDADRSRARELATIKTVEKLQPGIEFARYAMCLGAARGDLSVASAIAQKRYPHMDRVNNVLKAAVDAGTTTDATWAGPLVEYNQFAGDFVEYLRPQTIIGKFGTGNIPQLRRVPFNIHIRGQTSGGAGYWLGQGAPAPVIKADFNDTYLGFTKVGNLAVLSEELLRFSNPSAEMLVRDTLAESLIARLDTDFVDPTKAAVANTSPASISNGVAAIISAGSTADDVRADIKVAMTKFITANITPTAAVWIMSAATALALSLMRNALGQREFPDIEMTGGKLQGVPVITSQYVANDSNGGFALLVNASDVWLADDGVVVIDASREASVQMLDNPTNNASSGTPTTMVSMFQTQSVALRAIRWINWQKRRAAACAVVSHVAWGS